MVMVMVVDFNYGKPVDAVLPHNIFTHHPPHPSLLSWWWLSKQDLQLRGTRRNQNMKLLSATTNLGHDNFFLI
jgi:hypothetical protein